MTHTVRYSLWPGFSLTPPAVTSHLIVGQDLGAVLAETKRVRVAGGHSTVALGYLSQAEFSSEPYRP